MRGRRRGGQGIRAIGPGEDGFETPGADEGFGFGAGGHFGERIDGSTCPLILQKETTYVGSTQHLGRNCIKVAKIYVLQSIVATTGTRTQTSSMGSSNSTLELLSPIQFQALSVKIIFDSQYRDSLETICDSNDGFRKSIGYEDK